MINLENLKIVLSSPKDIVITSHRNPDGDAVGSSLALYHFLKTYNHSITVAFPSEFPPIFGWMKDSDKILIYDIHTEALNAKIDQADLVFALDYNSLDRIDRMGDYIRKADKQIAMIDHHLYPDDFAEFVFSDTTASSTCEMIYDFIQMLNKDKDLTLEIGEYIYTGILTDTGSFKYATSPKLFKIVSALMEKGIDNDKLQGAIFNSLNIKNLKLLGHCLHNRMEYLEEFKTGIITLTKKDYEHFDIQRGDTEGIVNYLLMVKDIHLAAFITEQPTIVKISLRSKGDIAVNEICSKYFKGGGHKNASGGAYYGSLSNTLRKFKEILPTVARLQTA